MQERRDVRLLEMEMLAGLLGDEARQARLDATTLLYARRRFIELADELKEEKKRRHESGLADMDLQRQLEDYERAGLL